MVWTCSGQSAAHWLYWNGLLEPSLFVWSISDFMNDERWFRWAAQQPDNKIYRRAALSGCRIPHGSSRFLTVPIVDKSRIISRAFNYQAVLDADPHFTFKRRYFLIEFIVRTSSGELSSSLHLDTFMSRSFMSLTELLPRSFSAQLWSQWFSIITCYIVSL